MEKFLVSLCDEAIFIGYLQEVQAKGSQINKKEMWQLWLSKQIHTQSLAAVRRAVQDGSRSPVKKTPVKTARNKPQDEYTKRENFNALLFPSPNKDSDKGRSESPDCVSAANLSNASN